MPRWNVLLLRVQLFIVYFYGAIAKLNPDWLRRRADVLRDRAPRAPDVPEIAEHFPPALLAYAIAYGGILFDASVPMLLCFRRTRLIGFCSRGRLPLPERDLSEHRRVLVPDDRRRSRSSSIPIGRAGSRRRWMGAAARRQRRRASTPASAVASRGADAGLALLHLYVLAQLLVPLRHWLYPGTVSWTEEGHRFSWHMKLRAQDRRR